MDQEKPDLKIRLNEVILRKFSRQATSSLKKKIKDYVSLLLSESIKVSKRQQADVVSSIHVNRANDYLVFNSKKRIFKHIGLLGGILIGASLSAFITVIVTDSLTILGMLLSTSLGIVGAFMFALSIVKDR